MSKAILVIDMPESCIGCDFNYSVNSESSCKEDMVCMALAGKVIDGFTNKYDGCPLKELPKKFIYTDILSMPTVNYTDGWNACIDEILGE